LTIKEAYRSGISQLQNRFGKRESEAMIRLIFRDMNLSPAFILAHDEEPLPSGDFERLQHIIGELLNGRPLQYILGYAWFHDLKLAVNDTVLIPRPETEELTDYILKDCPFPEPFILDIGTGSGAIAVTLAKKLPAANVYASDISDKAILTAEKNAESNGTSVKFIRHDILNLSGWNNIPSFDVIVSNPPYIRLSEKKFMEKNVLDYEPQEALFVNDNDPLIYYRAIRNFAMKHLKSGGLIYLEINESLGFKTASLFSSPGFLSTVVMKDLQEKDRFIKTVRA
jgi:release factor glutamine methyltransferase